MYVLVFWQEDHQLTRYTLSDFLKAMVWARKYGLRIKLDLHAVPGSQKYVRAMLRPVHELTRFSVAATITADDLAKSASSTA